MSEGSQVIQFASVPLEVDVLDGASPDDLIERARRIRDESRLALLQHRPSLLITRSFKPSLLDLESLVEAIGECAAMPLAVTEANGIAPLLTAKPYPCLLGDPDRLVAVALQAGVSAAAICRSRPTRTDFRDFITAWSVSGESETSAEIYDRLRTPGEGKSVMAFLIGKLLAEGHRQGVLHGNSHPSSFAIGTDGVVKILDHAARFLYRPPASAQCAADLVPLLESLSGADWRAFRLGYLREWPDGRRVTDLIEYGDTTGWMQPFARRQFGAAATLLNTALATCPPEDALAHLALSASLAFAEGMEGRHDQACTRMDMCVQAAATIAPELLPILKLHAGMARLRAGQPGAAARELVTLLAGQRTPTLKNLAARALRVAYADPEENLQPPTDDLPFFARRGNQIWLLELFKEGRL